MRETRSSCSGRRFRDRFRHIEEVARQQGRDLGEMTLAEMDAIWDEAKKQGAVLAWGKFVTVMINFIIIAFVLFLVVKGMNKLKRQSQSAPATPPEPSADVKLLMEIRDLLARR